MEYGPFHQLDIDEVKETLNRAHVPFTVVVKQEELDRAKAEYNEQANLNPKMSAGTFDPAYIYFDVAEEDYEKIVGLLEKYGVAQKGTGDELDGANYVCSSCHYSQAETGLCPKCQKELLTFDDYMNAKAAPSASGMGTYFAVIAVAAIFAVVWFLEHR